MADVFEASGEGLQALAAHCTMVSAELVAATPVPRVGLPVQATSGAVGATHAAVDGVITALAHRAQSSAVKSAVAGAQFAMTDAAGARQAAALVASISKV
ncbi:hypothetical protein A5647_17120 [Mycobacterium sp. 1100029.7]|nr:hypothetical protein A5647_17120 [Mycobacterium sp. 1100029.7]